MTAIDHLAQARASLAAATTEGVSARVHRVHMAVARASFDKAKAELANFEMLLKLHELRLDYPDGGEG